MQWLEGLNKNVENILKFKNVILLPDTLSKELNLFFLYFTFYRRDGTFKKKTLHATKSIFKVIYVNVQY